MLICQKGVGIFSQKMGFTYPNLRGNRVDFLSETLATTGLQAIYVTFGGNALAPLSRVVGLCANNFGEF